jgi:hypothetical protein
MYVPVICSTPVVTKIYFRWFTVTVLTAYVCIRPPDAAYVNITMKLPLRKAGSTAYDNHFL